MFWRDSWTFNLTRYSHSMITNTNVPPLSYRGSRNVSNVPPLSYRGYLLVFQMFLHWATPDISYCSNVPPSSYRGYLLMHLCSLTHSEMFLASILDATSHAPLSFHQLHSPRAKLEYFNVGGNMYSSSSRANAYNTSLATQRCLYRMFVELSFPGFNRWPTSPDRHDGLL